MKYIYIDTETTGLADDDQILEFAAYSDEWSFSTYVKPSKYLIDRGWHDAEKIHRISKKTALSSEVAYICVLPALYKIKRLISEGYKAVIYNSQFDLRIIEQTLPALKVDFLRDNTICAMLSYSHYRQEFRGDGRLKWHKLVDACRHEKIDISELTLHSALSDCIATKLLAEKTFLK